MSRDRRETLGALEHVVLLAVARLPGRAYGITIRAEIEHQAGRVLSLGAIYPTLDRLEEKGFVSSSMSDPTGVRGGRSRRIYELSPEGAAALEQLRSELTGLWAGLRLNRRPAS
jgi:DNA-binding PadR family transcriptional regulator